VQFKKHSAWSFVPEEKVTLTGAHGSEIVRSFCFLDSVSVLPRSIILTFSDPVRSIKPFSLLGKTVKSRLGGANEGAICVGMTDLKSPIKLLSSQHLGAPWP
jgi:hypothetical protein